MRPVDFLHLMACAKRTSWKAGDCVVVQGEEHKHLHLVLSGNLSVKHDFADEPNCYDIVGEVNPNQFIGEMSFLRWAARVKRARASQNDFLRSIFSTITDFNNMLPDFLDSAREDATPAVRDGHDEASSTVTCTEECVLYSWSFADLMEVTEAHPNIDVVFERSIASDLNVKMMAALKEPHFRYKRSLFGVLAKGHLTENERNTLEKARIDNNISHDEQLRLLSQLGWNLEQFNSGSKRFV
jgi:CRP-like cAMP-binding protein